MEALEKPEQTEKGNTDVIFVLLLLQGAIGIVAGLGLLIFTAGSPLAILSGFARPAVLFILAAGVVRGAHRVGRRWTRKATMIVEGLSLASFVVNAAIGLLGEVDFTINLVTLITNVALPVAVIVLLLNDRPRPQIEPPATGDLEGAA